MTQENVQLTASEQWERLSSMDPAERIERLENLLERAQEGSSCSLGMHRADLADQAETISRLCRENRHWNTARRLITIFIGTLRQEPERTVLRRSVADRLETLLLPGSEPVDNRARRILCGYPWEESGRQFQCAEPVDVEGLHQGDHYAYVREGSSRDEELRMKLLEDENEELRRRLGLPLNRRITRPAARLD